MILCACFYIDKTEWFEEQFLYSRHLYNQGRYVINNHYKKHKNFITYISHLNMLNYRL